MTMCIAVGVVFALLGWQNALATFLSYFLGVWGWAQIIGSLQNIRARGATATAITIIIWVIILGVATLAVHFYVSMVMLGYLIGLAISLVHILASGRMK